MTARSYLTGLARVFDTIEATDAKGDPLALDAAMEVAVDAVVALKGSARKTMLIGNGGSAAIVSHMQNDLFKMLNVRAMVFTEQPLLTALANDDGYDTVFRRPVQTWAMPGDLLLAVSSSGESASIVSAVSAARERECQVITLSGFKPGNRLRQQGDVNFYVPFEAYGYVEMTHAILLHCLADLAVLRDRQHSAG